MSLQRRLLVYLLLCAPVVWGLALAVSASRARHEVNELFDTEMIHLARQVQSTLVGLRQPGLAAPVPRAAGEADLRDLAIVVWNARGEVVLVDREGVHLPHRPDVAGFLDLTLAGAAWRAYYLQSPRGEWLVAAAQLRSERDELVQGLVGGQLLPWLLVLPVLLLTMAWAVRQALAPLRHLADELRQRQPDALQPLAQARAPAELQPLLDAMNGLFARIDDTLARERRFTADAAHELRTPLAVLRAQWDVQRQARDDDERRRAEAGMAAGLDRLDRLVSQMLSLARVDALQRLAQAPPVDWPAVVAEVMDDVLPLAERRRIELACDWPPEGAAPLPLHGDAGLLAVLLRNLVDNAVRYAPEGSTVTVRFEPGAVAVHNAGPALPASVLSRLGERFRRRDGQAELGSGLGVSIAQRIAMLHGLQLGHQAGPDGQGVVARLALAVSAP